MKKNLKIVAILLVIATVVFAAGCAEKTTTSGNKTSGNETPDVSNQTTTAVSATPSPVEAPNVTEKANETVAEDSNIEKTENITEPVIRKSTYVAPHEPSSEANQITYTAYGNSENKTQVASNKQGTLKIISSGTNTTQENTTQGNTTTTSDPLRKQKIAQNHTSTNGTISV